MANQAKTPTKADLFSSPSAFLGLGLGSGLAPKAPGTFGTLAAIPVFLLLATLGQGIYLIALTISIVLGISICGNTAKQLDSHDHPAIVWDEFAGYFVTMLPVMITTTTPLTTLNVIIGFILFRIFDIIKPWPIKMIDQKIHGGFGIMLDDLIAGIFAAIMLWGFNAWNPAELFRPNFF